MLFETLDHTAIAVPDLDEALRFHQDVLGLTLVHRETIADQQVEAALLTVGDAQIELISPAAPDTSVARFIERHGPGLHHLAYRVRDIDAVLSNLADAGIELIDTTPRRGVRDSLVAFVHPSATGGVLTEIVQPAEH